EAASGRMSVLERGIIVPNLSRRDQVQVSPVVLAADLEKLRPDRLLGREFLAGQFKIRPNSSGSYPRDDYLPVYFEVYDYSAAASSNAGQLMVEYAIASKGAAKPPVFRDITRSVLADGDRILVPRQVSLSSYAPGEYELQLRVRDRIAGQTAVQS